MQQALEGLHSHILLAIPSHRCGIMPFQVNIQYVPLLNFSTAEEEQEAEEDADSSSQDEGADERAEEENEGFSETRDFPVTTLMSVSTHHTLLTKEKHVKEEVSPAM